MTGKKIITGLAFADVLSGADAMVSQNEAASKKKSIFKKLLTESSLGKVVGKMGQGIKHQFVEDEDIVFNLSDRHRCKVRVTKKMFGNNKKALRAKVKETLDAFGRISYTDEKDQLDVPLHSIPDNYNGGTEWGKGRCHLTAPMEDCRDATQSWLMDIYEVLSANPTLQTQKETFFAEI
jgi:hypothetical protein